MSWLRAPRTPDWRRRGSILALGVLVLLLADGTAAHETDQFTIRGHQIEDSTDELNAMFNQMLGEIADRWLGGPDRRAFANEVFNKMGGITHLDKYERWARKSPDVDKVHLSRQESIYRGGPFWETRVVYFYGLGPILRVNDHFMGVDKMGHFFSLGWKYYKRYMKGVEEDLVVGIGKRNEAGIFGFLTTGVYSNADLVANYEGFRFYRSLFEDDIVEGKPALIEWLGVGARLQREFDWRDHVNEYWDEAKNPGLYDFLLRKRVQRNMEALCPLFHEMPEEFQPAYDEALEERYAHLGLRDSSGNTLAALCTVETAESSVSSRH